MKLNSEENRLLLTILRQQLEQPEVILKQYDWKFSLKPLRMLTEEGAFVTSELSMPAAHFKREVKEALYYYCLGSTRGTNALVYVSCKRHFTFDTDNWKVYARGMG